MFVLYFVPTYKISKKSFVFGCLFFFFCVFRQLQVVRKFVIGQYYVFFSIFVLTIESSKEVRCNLVFFFLHFCFDN